MMMRRTGQGMTSHHDVASLSHVTQSHDACSHDVNTQQSTLRMRHLHEEHLQQLTTCVQKRFASLHILTPALDSR
jgi:hypothetical protein